MAERTIVRSGHEERLDQAKKNDGAIVRRCIVLHVPKSNIDSRSAQGKSYDECKICNGRYSSLRTFEAILAAETAVPEAESAALRM